MRTPSSSPDQVAQTCFRFCNGLLLFLVWKRRLLPRESGRGRCTLCTPKLETKSFLCLLPGAGMAEVEGEGLKQPVDRFGTLRYRPKPSDRVFGVTYRLLLASAPGSAG